MGETFRVSVRELVAFFYFPPDITPADGRTVRGRKAQGAREKRASVTPLPAWGRK